MPCHLPVKTGNSLWHRTIEDIIVKLNRTAQDTGTWNNGGAEACAAFLPLSYLFMFKCMLKLEKNSFRYSQKKVNCCIPSPSPQLNPLRTYSCTLHRTHRKAKS